MSLTWSKTPKTGFLVTWLKLAESLLITCRQCFYLGFWEATCTFTFGKKMKTFHCIWEKLHKIGKKKAIFGLGMPPVTGGKSGQLKSLVGELERVRVLANHQQFMNHTNISYF